MRIKEYGPVTRTICEETRTVTLTLRSAGNEEQLVNDGWVQDQRKFALREVERQLINGYELIDETGM